MREHVAAVVPRKHLNNEIESECVPDPALEDGIEGDVSSRRNDETPECPSLLGNDESRDQITNHPRL